MQGCTGTGFESPLRASESRRCATGAGAFVLPLAGMRPVLHVRRELIRIEVRVSIDAGRGFAWIDFDATRGELLCLHYRIELPTRGAAELWHRDPTVDHASVLMNATVLLVRDACTRFGTRRTVVEHVFDVATALERRCLQELDFLLPGTDPETA